MIDSVNWTVLRQAAVEVRQNAHAPYSRFYVGAAIWSHGQIYVGCNVENASYPVGLCAERAALAAAVSSGCRDIEAVCVAGAGAISPCGMCRQALVEFNSDVPLLLVNTDTMEESRVSLSDLLPSPFRGD